MQNVKKALVLEHFGALRKVDKIHYKTCRLWSPLGPFSRNGLKKYPKALGFPVKVGAVLRLRKTSKPLVKQCFGATEKVDANTL